MYHSKQGYDDCPFFFWLHSYFVRDGGEECEKDGEDVKVVLFREHLDNPHKMKTWGVWGADFSVEVVFSDSESMLQSNVSSQL